MALWREASYSSLAEYSDTDKSMSLQRNNGAHVIIFQESVFAQCAKVIKRHVYPSSPLRKQVASQIVLTDCS